MLPPRRMRRLRGLTPDLTLRGWLGNFLEILRPWTCLCPVKTGTPLRENTEKKKVAVGVRCMKLAGNDYVDAVYYTREYDDAVLEAGGKKLEINSTLKLSKRDGKGSRLK